MANCVHEKHNIYVYYHLYKLNRIELFHQICLEAFSMKIAEFFKTCVVWLTTLFVNLSIYFHIFAVKNNGFGNIAVPLSVST